MKSSLRRGAAFDDRFGAGLCLEVLGWIAARQGLSVEAAELLGAAQASLTSIGSTVGAIEAMLVEHRRCLQTLQKLMGERTFTAASQRGKDSRVALLDALVHGLGSAKPKASPAVAAAVLTAREAEIAALVGDGLTNRQIAAKLFISQRTAEGHVEHILAKLGFNTRAQIATWIARTRDSNGSQ
jgi:DNA-binding CsgD family transcriptional regulator